MSVSMFLDDERLPHEVKWVNGFPANVSWEVYRDPTLFISQVEDLRIQPDNMAFDHDIQYFDVNGKEITGYDVVKAVVDIFLDRKWPINDTRWWFHTQNEIGGKNMRIYVSNAMKSQRAHVVQ